MNIQVHFVPVKYLSGLDLLIFFITRLELGGFACTFGLGGLDWSVGIRAIWQGTLQAPLGKGHGNGIPNTRRDAVSTPWPGCIEHLSALPSA